MFTNALNGGLTGTFATTPVIYAPGVNDMAVYFDGISQFLEFGDSTSRCFGNTELCPYGSSYSFWIWFGTKQATSVERGYVLSSGSPGSQGIGIYVEAGMLYILVSTKSFLWGPVSVAVLPKTWYQVSFSWSINAGLWVYINGVQVGQNVTPSSIPLVQVSSYQDLVIGKSNDAQSLSGEFYIDDLSFWNQYQELPFFTELYVNASFSKCQLCHRVVT